MNDSLNRILMSYQKSREPFILQNLGIYSLHRKRGLARLLRYRYVLPESLISKVFKVEWTVWCGGCNRYHRMVFYNDFPI